MLWIGLCHSADILNGSVDAEGKAGIIADRNSAIGTLTIVNDLFGTFRPNANSVVFSRTTPGHVRNAFQSWMFFEVSVDLVHN
jgi:hypothetical protein